MINLESITQFILPLLLSYFAYLYGRKKDEAEIKKLEIESKNLGIQARKLELEADQKEIEAEKSEIDVMDRTVEFYKSKMAEMLDEIEDLKEQISELKEIYNVIKNLSHIDDIPNFRNYIEENPQNGIISKDFYKLDLFYKLKTTLCSLCLCGFLFYFKVFATFPQAAMVASKSS